MQTTAFAAAYERQQTERELREAIKARHRCSSKSHYRANSKRKALNRIKTQRGCKRCGVKGLPPAAYDFHHRDPDTKSFNPSRLPSRDWATLRAEIEKCDVLCATCHRITEAEARQAGP